MGQVAWVSETDGDPEAVRAVLETRLAPHAVNPVMPSAEVRTRLGAMAASGTQRIVVEFDRAVTPEQRQALADAGVRLLSPLGGGAYFATVTADTLKADAVAQRFTVRAVESIRSEWKTHPLMQAGALPEYAVRGEGEQAVVAAYLVLHKDVSADEANAIVAAHNAVVRRSLRSINAMVIEVPVASLDGLIGADEVQWVEPALPPLSTLNAENRVLTQVETLQQSPYNLDGTGITAMIYDGGTARSTHQDFSGRLTVHDSSGTFDHPTHVAATVGGDGSVNSNHRGMAPNVTLRAFGFEDNGTGTFLYTDPGDIEADYTTAFASLGAHVANNSIGTNVEVNGFPCSMHGDYGVTDSIIDAIIRGSLGVETRIVWAAGNERQGSRCDVEGFGDYYSIAPPSGAKNHISVGAVNANNDSMTSFSSWGPVDDGRIVPQVVAPGCQSTGDFGVTSASSSGDTAYTVKCGTSMAAPTVTGIVALMLEDFAAQYPSDPLPTNSMVKAMLVHNAEDIGTVGPDYQNGYGSVRAQDTIDFIRSGNFGDGEVGDGGVATALVTVNPGDSEFKATLVWDDVPGSPNVSPSLVNDLDLVVTDPNGIRRYPWTLDPSNPTAAAVQTQEDHLNNIEQVAVSSPAAGVWTIEVRGTSVPDGPQSFSLASTGALSLAALEISVVGGISEYVDPGQPVPLTVDVQAFGQSVIANTTMMHWRMSESDSFQATQMTDAGGGTYTAALPAPDCDDSPQYYFSADGDVSGTVTLPSTAPAAYLAATVGEAIISFEDDLETDLGWTVGAPDDDATTGIWTRMAPEATAAQPGLDHTPSGMLCWVTNGFAGGTLGAFDVDGGKTTLTTPVIDLSGVSDATISYWRWFSNDTGAGPNEDVFVVEISNDGSSWSVVETVGPAGIGTSGGWFEHQFNVADFVTPTAQVQLRFIAADEGDGSLVEAAVDDVQVLSVECVAAPPPPCAGDVDGDNDVDLEDFTDLASNFGAGPGATQAMGDLTGDGFVDLADFSLLASSFGEVCP
ncbi:MAG: S8 family serine peptidase [Planctomycetota bacterium]